MGHNDPAGNGVDIAGGTGNIPIAASVTKITGGGEVVDVNSRTGGTTAFSGTISASGGDGGITSPATPAARSTSPVRQR